MLIVSRSTTVCLLITADPSLAHIQVRFSSRPQNQSTDVATPDPQIPHPQQAALIVIPNTYGYTDDPRW